MRTFSSIAAAVLLCATVPCLGLTHTHRTGSAHANIRHSAVRFRHGRASIRHEALPQMDPDRATQIQSALIKSGYLTGVPSGTWDAHTAAAMQRLQGDNGWQTRITPDSRALIKLGLGPQRDYQASNTMPR
ncbi:MAG TPA: peptidoglycan-binding domain-containing protein [Acidobacteriaceae bacterium]|nr:peptidoglycan-binding domain-containing protein [Acidobacteriaceae bacterium]